MTPRARADELAALAERGRQLADSTNTSEALRCTGSISCLKKEQARKWALPAIRGVQARHEYYVVLVKMRELPRLFAAIDAKGPPELRAQRALNKARAPKIAEYILGNPNDYTFSFLMGDVDRQPRRSRPARRACGRSVGDTAGVSRARMLSPQGRSAERQPFKVANVTLPTPGLACILPESLINGLASTVVRGHPRHVFLLSHD
ncbi:hypothetical protein BE21_19955 [Sorangium cellulosum]|uniref:Uncharacterized protein n=1 Tax=Sorangium cellulosum TaxID=56 RepID=A0A150TWK3_SORCE|nr:hypothetical protein BE21_19955 [Sorangium cellulosum]